MDKNEVDITYKKYQDEESSKREGSENSYSVINANNLQQEQSDNYYEGVGRKSSKSSLRKNSTIRSKIILYKQRTNYKGKKMFQITSAILGVVGIVLLVLFIIIMARKGWARSNFYDISSGNRIALLLQSVFIIFISVIGLLGGMTYWKPIIVMISLLSVLAFISHAYVAKQFYDISRFASRDMAVSWWDNYDDENIISIQEEFKCCGYLNYKDRAYMSNNCPKELVVYTVPEDVYLAAKVKKNDTYKRKYWKENTNPAAGNTASNTAGNTGNTAANTGATTTTTTNTVVNNDDDETDFDRRKRSVNVINADNSDEVFKKIGEEIKNKISNGKGKILINPNIKEKRQEEGNGEDNYNDDGGDDEDENVEGSPGQIDTTAGQTTGGQTTEGQTTEGQTTEGQTTNDQTTTGQTTTGQTTTGQTTTGQTTTGQTTTGQTTAGQTTPGQTTVSGDNIVGCKAAITDKVQSAVTPLYIILFITLIVYIGVFASSVIYWLDLRNEKEYDEFS